MKKLRSIIIVAVLVAIASITHAQVKTQFVANTYPGAITHLHLPNVEVQYQVTDDLVLSFEIDITTNTHKHKVFDYLVEAGRYDLTIENTGKELFIKMPNLRKDIRINERQFQDKVNLKVYIPRGIKVAKSIPIIKDFPVSTELLAWQKTRS